jgi:hypothetical protein
MAELELDRIVDAQEQAAAFIRTAEAPKLPTMPPALFDAVRGLDMQLGSSALAASAKACLRAQPLLGSAITEAMKSYEGRLNTPGVLALALQTSSIGNVQALATAIQPEIGLLDEALRVRLSEALGSPIAEVLKTFQSRLPLISEMSEAIRRASLGPGLRFAPVEVVRRAAEIAEDRATEEVAADAVASLDLARASSAERSQLKASVVDAIGRFALLAALLIHSRRLELAAVLLALIASLIAIHGQIDDH